MGPKAQTVISCYTEIARGRWILRFACRRIIAATQLALTQSKPQLYHHWAIASKVAVRIPYFCHRNNVYQSRGQSAYFFLAAAPVLIDTARWYFSSQYNQPPDIFTGYPKDSIGREQVIKELVSRLEAESPVIALTGSFGDGKSWVLQKSRRQAEKRS
jgi:hypothetical protein